MSPLGITLDGLRACLTATPPVDLLGMRLLQTHSQPTFFPTDIPREALKEAVAEIVTYTERCAAARQRLADLRSIPLTTVSIPEFAL
jgi:hypothetical protein